MASFADIAMQPLLPGVDTEEDLRLREKFFEKYGAKLLEFSAPFRIVRIGAKVYGIGKGVITVIRTGQDYGVPSNEFTRELAVQIADTFEIPLEEVLDVIGAKQPVAHDDAPQPPPGDQVRTGWIDP